MVPNPKADNYRNTDDRREFLSLKIKISAVNTILLIASATLMALVAGLMYAYSCSVNPGLGKLPDHAYLLAMQSINKEIQNPWFFLSFMGALCLLPLSTWGAYRSGNVNTAWLLLGATIIYVLGVFAVTVMGNVPLNNSLANFTVTGASAPEMAQQRRLFEQPWNRLHLVRTIASILSLVLVLIACVEAGKRDL